MTETVLLWALWSFTQGQAGVLHTPSVTSYFKSLQECQRVSSVIATNATRFKCVQGAYTLPTTIEGK